MSSAASRVPAAATASGEAAPDVPRFYAPFRWDEVDEVTRTLGTAVLTGLVDTDLLARFGGEVDRWLERNPDSACPDSGSPVYDTFMGRRTARLQGLLAKAPAAADLIRHPGILGWARRLLAPVCDGVQLSAAEFIQIGPRERRQYTHRDSDAWWFAPRGPDPLCVNAMVAMTPFDERNGATRVVPGSCGWPEGRRPVDGEAVQPRLDPGDVLLFRADVFHGGGANRTTDQFRRGVVLSYCAGWLRPLENSFLNVPRRVAAGLPEEVAELLGYRIHDSTARGGGIIGTHEYGDPRRALHA
ncbi:phytanoyl-CoA dioxygenase family protein [Actinomadura sp. WMMB 499]|uniref:phytanoyl-CoA dioxygenase family protein n=1 Tax=Actinomadura sp. WMMB 499 TaxID=1219491 RepID=UPI001243B02E|nr:phytanoyl-CoA dioxygenase family protein [Actinomadura sp. WMMB 499]QFG22456.1 hypothetical protein F7P10_16320 [Actinomadura sp. WMMB 499]